MSIKLTKTGLKVKVHQKLITSELGVNCELWMNNYMNEFHSSCESDVHNIISPPIDEFHKEWWFWACLDTIDEKFSTSPCDLIMCIMDFQMH